MSSPISNWLFGTLLFTALAGCGSEDSASPQNKVGTGQKPKADGKIECALAGSAIFARVCSTEQITANGTIILVLRHPNGGFRRFNLLNNGRGLSVADGFDETRISLLEDGMIELSSGDDKYRLPAQFKNTPPVNSREIAKHAS